MRGTHMDSPNTPSRVASAVSGLGGGEQSRGLVAQCGGDVGAFVASLRHLREDGQAARADAHLGHGEEAAEQNQKRS